MIFTKAEYIVSINGLLPDNATQEISPLDLRTSLINLIDSVPEFMIGTKLNTTNFATPDVRTTKAGEFALSNMFLAGRTSVDNAAFGYASLRNNYSGSGNTAIGSYSLACNLYGSSNSALGLLSLGGNTIGSGNVGLGSFTLHNNKQGDFNIAIGHGAGWHIGPNSDYNFVVSASPISVGSTCDENGDPVFENDLPPLLFGNLEAGSHQLAVGTESLHSYGMLQVSGDISPTISGDFSLGRSQTPWGSINEEVYFSGSYVGIGGQPSGALQNVPDGRLTVYGDLVPNRDERYALGHPELKWDGYFNDVVISGQAFINDAQYNTVSQCLYECKTLHLATSGFCDPEDEGFHNSAVCGFLDDVSLDGAGFEIHSSGAAAEYRRDYHFVYRQPDATIRCLPQDNPFTRSRFESNISLELESGRALITDRVIGRNRASLVASSGCMGVFINPVDASGQTINFMQEEHLDQDYYGLTDANFISRSGTNVIEGSPSGYNYGVTYGTVDSGVKVMQRFLSRIGSDGIRGFSLVYHDERDSDGEIDCGLLGYNDFNCINDTGLIECEPIPVP